MIDDQSKCLFDIRQSFPDLGLINWILHIHLRSRNLFVGIAVSRGLQSNALARLNELPILENLFQPKGKSGSTLASDGKAISDHLEQFLFCLWPIVG